MTEQEAASARLNEAERLRAAVLRAAKWSATFLVVFGIAETLAGLALAIFPRAETVAWTISPLMLLVAGMAIWAARQRVHVRQFGIILGVSFGVWGALWGLFTVLVTVVIKGETALTVAAALVQPLPLFAGALLIWRRR